LASAGEVKHHRTQKNPKLYHYPAPLHDVRAAKSKPEAHMPADAESIDDAETIEAFFPSLLVA
jgi:hypothetical protein